MEGSSVQIRIRTVSVEDANAIAEIYGHHVLHGTASYEVDPPSVEDTVAKIRRITGPGWPFLVAEIGGNVAGYAYATQFRDRAAYRFTCEDSIYVDPEMMGRGVGRALLEALVEASAEHGFRTMVAVIGGAEPRSVALHSRCDFEHVGRLKAVGFKFGRWLDSVYMQRDLPGKGTRVAG
jgi:phosphinothricin acetyltransferase